MSAGKLKRGVQESEVETYLIEQVPQMKMISKNDPEPTIVLQLTKYEFKEIFAAVAHYHEYLGGCTLSSLAQIMTKQLIDEMDNMDNWS